MVIHGVEDVRKYTITKGDELMKKERKKGLRDEYNSIFYQISGFAVAV